MASRWPFLALAAACVLWGVVAHATRVRASAPPTPSESQSRIVSPSGEYVGAARCATCHAELHAMWKDGRHSKMLQPASAATVIGDFSRGALSLDGKQYEVREGAGSFFITESDLTGQPREHRVEFTLGSRRIQHYLSTLANGEIVVLSPTWDVERRQWFHNTEIVQPTRNRVVVQQWNKSCVGCHVSGQANHYDPVGRTYRTQWTDFGTSCERCHGPGRRHAEGNPQDVQSARASIVKPTRLDPRTSSAICAQCHSLRTDINPNYTAGAEYYDFFLPVLEYGVDPRAAGSRDPAYWADGRPRRFSNDALGLWQSGCFLRGGATCTTCHLNPHLPNVDRNPQLSGPASNALCAGCHEPIAARLSEHTRHSSASSGSVCVDCHMPKTVVGIKAKMRDHSISVPAPENTAKFAIPNACTECHRDKPASWAVNTLRDWYPNGRRQRLIAQAEAFTAARAGQSDAIQPLIAMAADTSLPPLVRANAVGHLGRFADARAQAAIVRAGDRQEDPAVRLSAVAALRGPALPTDASQAAILSALADPRRAVRVAAALTVADRGGRELPLTHRSQFRVIADELALWTGRHQDDAGLQRTQGLVHLLGGNIEAAAGALARSLSLDANVTQTKFLLALARLGQGRADEARRLFREIPRGDQFHAIAQQQLNALGGTR